MKVQHRILPLMVLMCGCGSAPRGEAVDMSAWQSPHAPAVQHVSSVEVAAGPLPLVYQITQPGTVRVVDAQTLAEVAHEPAQPGQIVAVDHNRGVSVGGRRLSERRLNAEHRYAIYLDMPRPEAGPPVDEKHQSPKP